MTDQHHTHDHPPVGGGQECLACPVCVLLQALSTSRPEVVEHLVAAGRELTLAVAALVEGQVAAHDRADRRRRDRGADGEPADAAADDGRVRRIRVEE